MRLPYARPVLPGARFLRLARRKRFFETPLRVPGAAAGCAYVLRWPCKGLLSACGSKCRAFPFPPGPQARGHCFSAGGGRSGNPPLAASPARGRGQNLFTGHYWPRRCCKGTLPFPETKYPGKAGKTANRAEYRGKLRQVKIITPGRAYGLRGACKGLLSACGSKCRAFPFPPARKPAAIAISRASLQNAARPKRGARHFLPAFCSMHAPQAPVLGLPLSPLLPGDGGVLPSSYS